MQKREFYLLDDCIYHIGNNLFCTIFNLLSLARYVYIAGQQIIACVQIHKVDKHFLLDHIYNDQHDCLIHEFNIITANRC